MVKWIFEKDSYQDGNLDYMQARCKKMNIPCAVVEHVIFGSADHIKWPFEQNDHVIAYGSIGFAKFLNRNSRWIPGVWSDFEKLKCTTYLTHWGQFSVQEDYSFLPFREVYRLKDKMFSRHEKDDHIFIRPDSNDKVFHGEKVCKELFEKWWRIANIYDPDPNQLTMVSTPTKIEHEWRFVIADRKVVTGSRYIHSDDGNVAHAKIGEFELDNSASICAEKIANYCDWQPAPIYTLDVCKTNDGFKLLECGSVNTSGLYKCDLDKVMEAAESIAQKEIEELCI